MARIYRRKGSKFYWTDTTDLPGGRRQSTKTKDETLAKKILGDRIAEHDDGRETGTMSYKSAESIYLNHRKGKNKKTYQASRLALGEFREICNLTAIRRTLLEHLRRYRDYLRHERQSQGEGSGQAQANKLFREVLKFLAYCEDEEWIDPQRWSKIDKPFKDAKPRKFRFTVAQIEEALAQFKTNDIGTTVRLAYYAGLRRGAIFYLEIRDLVFDMRPVDPKKDQSRIVLNLKPHWQPKGYEEGDPVRVVPMHQNLKKYLLKLLAKRKPKPQPQDRIVRVFPSLERMSVVVVEALRDLKWKDGQQVFPKGSIHTFRHSIIGHLLDAGEPGPHVQKFVHHKKLQQTMDYADVADEVVGGILKSVPVRERKK